MRSIVRLAIAATLAASVAATPHNHHHHHVKKDVPLDKRAPGVVVKEAGVVIKYEMGGKIISYEDAQKGIESGLYVVVGQTAEADTVSSPPEDAEFVEVKLSKSSSSSSTPSPTPIPPSLPPSPASPSPTASRSPSPPPQPYAPSPSSHQQPSAPTPSSNAHNQPSVSPVSSGQGLDSEFPSGKIPCSHFPSEYGPIALPYLGLGGWSGIQRCPNYNYGDRSISFIETGVPGDSGCSPNSFCIYSCPVGYQKTQWPEAQGSTKESIGGIFCNKQGFLELTRPVKKTLCEQGVGGVTVQNDLPQQVCVCRTDYPGTESMVIPTVPQPGQSLPLTNPDSSDYYEWDGRPTTAQYYVNKAGYSVEDSCVWKSKRDPQGAGNWAPINIGLGKAKDGNTYISIFNNAPTSHAKLDFNIEITGDINGKCSLTDGQYPGGGTGCTTAMRNGGKAVIRFFK